MTRAGITFEDGGVGDGPVVAGVSTYREESPIPGESIYDFALRTMGDALFAYIIILRNGLRPPYIVEDPRDRESGTVAPGDIVLVPAVGGTAQKPEEKDRPTYREVVEAVTPAGLSRPEWRAPWRKNEWRGFTVEIDEGRGEGQERLVESNTEYGLVVSPPWDILPDETSVFRLYFKEPKREDHGAAYLGTDILVRGATTPTGDLACVSGYANLAQALEIKLRAEPGDLILHPWFGMSAGVGRKANVFSAFRLRLNAEQTLLSDHRVASVDQIEVAFNGDKAAVNARVSVRGSGVLGISTNIEGT